MADKLRHLLLVTLENTRDPQAWSGSALAVRESLEQVVERVTVLDNLKVRKHPAHAALRLAFGTTRYGRHTVPRYPLWLTDPALRGFAQVTAEAIEQCAPDAVLAISLQPLVFLHEFLKRPLPVFSFSDASWSAWLEVYEGYWPRPMGAARYSRREGSAARGATGLFYGSEWAKADAVERFGVQPEKVHVQPMGATWTPESFGEAGSAFELERVVRARSRERLDLLFVAREWERKGGPPALAIARGLRESGRVGEVRLTVVGCAPEVPPEDSSLVRVMGELRRTEPGEAETLRRLFLESHFLVVPTVAECFGLVFAEAQAFALPSVSRAVHALPSVVLDGETGILEEQEAGAEPYVRRMLALLDGDRERYVQMALAGRRHYEARLNWPAFGQGVKRLIEGALDGG